MPLIEEFEASGHWLFRWRSYLPLIFTVLIFSGLSSFRYPFGSHFLDQLWEVICLGVSFLGFLVRAVTVGYAAGRTSGRNTKQQVADSLNTTGAYSVVRNPLYLGNFLIVLGAVVFLRIWWQPLLYLLLFALYYERIIFAEEMFLRRKFGRHYMDWASKTPAFFPRISQWKTPEVPFSWKKVLRREYHGVFGLIVAMLLLEIAGDLYSGHGFKVDVMWTIIFSVTAASYVILRFLHKRTAVFRGEGRRGSNHDTRRAAVR